jgi:hypothetical protein
MGSTSASRSGPGRSPGQLHRSLSQKGGRIGEPKEEAASPQGKAAKKIHEEDAAAEAGPKKIPETITQP